MLQSGPPGPAHPRGGQRRDAVPPRRGTAPDRAQDLDGAGGREQRNHRGPGVRLDGKRGNRAVRHDVGHRRPRSGGKVPQVDADPVARGQHPDAGQALHAVERVCHPVGDGTHSERLDVEPRRNGVGNVACVGGQDGDGRRGTEHLGTHAGRDGR